MIVCNPPLCRQVLKLYAWEEAFQARIEEIRVKELHVIKKAAMYFCGTVVTFTCAPVLVGHDYRLILEQA